jgi:hypothetical protein
MATQRRKVRLSGATRSYSINFKIATQEPVTEVVSKEVDEDLSSTNILRNGLTFSRRDATRYEFETTSQTKDQAYTVRNN